MAQTNLSPEVLNWLRANQNQQAVFTDPTSGLTYASLLSQGGAQGEAGEGNPMELFGYYGYEPGKTNVGDTMHLYGTDGGYQNTGKFESGESKWMLPAMLALTGLGMTMLPGGVFNGASSGVGNAGGFVGEGASSGIPAWDSALAGATPGQVTGAATGATGAMGQNGAFLGEGVSSGVPAWDAAAKAATGGAASLIPGISDKALGIGATVLGGLAGNEGTPGKSSETKMDPRLDQFVYGDLLPRAQGLLGQQMPMAQQYGNQMMQMGSGLLGAGIAPNGFERFTKGRY